MRPFRFCLVACAALAACGESKPAQSPQAPVAAEPKPPAPEPGPKDKIARATVDAALQAGLGKFLANVEVEAAVDAKGKFVGWKILELKGEMWNGVDLKVGDVVTRLNGFKIEREHEANAAFKSLAVASEIRVLLLRDGKPAELRFEIVDGDVPTPSASAK